MIFYFSSSLPLCSVLVIFCRLFLLLLSFDFFLHQMLQQRPVDDDTAFEFGTSEFYPSIHRQPHILCTGSRVNIKIKLVKTIS